MKLKQHVKRLEYRATRLRKDLDEALSAHRGLRVRARAAALVAANAEALLDCARAVAAAPEAAPGGGGGGGGGADGGGAGAGGEGAGAGGEGGAARAALLAAVSGNGELLQELRGEAAAAEAQLPPGGGGAAAAGAAPPGAALETRTSWWPAGAAHVPRALELRRAEHLFATMTDDWHAVGVLLP
jgi:hypothetical protein